MADFCKQCSIEQRGSDYGDMVNAGPFVVCDGCGVNCIVFRDGTCISEICSKKHGALQREGDESARVEQWAANYLDCQSEPDPIQPNYDDVQ